MPRDVTLNDIKTDLKGLPGVRSVHSANVWALTVDKVVLTAHLVVGEATQSMYHRKSRFTKLVYYIQHLNIMILLLRVVFDKPDALASVA